MMICGNRIGPAGSLSCALPGGHDGSCVPADKLAAAMNVARPRKLTREDRLATGWQRRWGVFDWNDRMWLSEDRAHWTSSVIHGSRMIADYRSAHDEATRFGNRDCVVVRPVWWREKPKASPPLKVGDVVTVRGVVCDLTPKDRSVGVRMARHGIAWVGEDDIVK